ncbi:MAG: GFA family protein [Gammaproteobacteria bacterium]|nr:GFA family protein [Gammaproteobacteria bacterium]
MNKESIHQGSCFCGEVTFTVSGEPELMAYCHCESCRSWSAGPVSAFTLWKPDDFKITGGLDNIAGFDKNPLSEEKNVVSNRVWCKTCGGHLYTDHPAMGLIDVPTVIISDFSFSPAFHVHYQESVHNMKDGLPKYKDLPSEAGGTGITLTE